MYVTDVIDWASFFKSTDEGLTWEDLQEHFPPSITHTPRVTVCEPENPQVVYIGCKDDGVWKHYNYGNPSYPWNEKNTGLTNFRPHVFEIDPNNPSTVYLGCHYPRENETGCCFKTTIGGDVWNDISPAVDDPGVLAIYDIETDPNSPNYVFMCGKGAPPGTPFVFKSTDGGDSWTSAYQGIEGTCLYSLAIDPDVGNIVYGGGAYHAPSMGIWKTTNGGSSWAKVYDLGTNCLALTILKVGANKYIFAATEGQKVFRSSDEGLTWQQLGTGIYDPMCWSILADQPTLSNPNGVVYLGTMRSFYRSTDLGESWEERMTGMHIADVWAVTANLPTLNCKSRCYGSGGGDVIHRSLNTGAEWQFVKAMPSGWMRTDILTDPSDGSRIHAVNADVDFNGQIWQSTDGGENWHIVYEIGPPPASAYFYCLAAVPPRIWYAGGQPLSSVNYSVMKSIDGGNNWVPVGNWPGGFGPKVYSILVDPLINDILYLGEIVHGVQKSTNSGQNWTVENDGMPYPITVNTLAMPVTNNNILFAGSNQGIYKTTDAADNWISSMTGLDYTFVKSLCEDPDEPSLIYAACQENENSTQGYVYASVDYGAKWFNLTIGLPPELVNDLTIDSDNTQYVWAATGEGVYTYTPDFNKSLVSSSSEATLANNGRNMMRIEGTDEIWVTYESGGVIYATRTTNGGFSWSKKMELGQGSYPVISYDPIAETPVPGVVWHYLDSENQHYIYFARHITGSQWSDPAVIVTSTSAIDPPSFAIAGGNWGHLAYTEGSTVKYTKFNILNPLPTTSEWVGTGHNPSIGYMMSATNPDIHITWENNDQIWYRHEPFGHGFAERVSHQSTTCHHPSLAIEGNVVYFVWEASGDISWRSLTCNHPFYTWGSIKPVCFTISVPSAYPVLTGGHFCSWVEEHTNNYEVYFSHYNPEVGGWTTPQNISTGATETFSNYPHITHYQTLLGTNVYFIWTEGSETIPQPTAPPYEIKFKTHAFGGPGEGGENALPMYVAQCGEQEPSPFTIRREGYTHYGSEPYKRIDHDAQYLEYQFTHLDSGKTYKIHVYLYQRGSSNLPITINIDGHQFDTIHILPDTLVIIVHVLPELLYKDGQITMKILGNKAVSAILVISEYEKDNKGGGPQSSQSLPDQAGVLALSILPNPAKEIVGIRYTLPIGTNVKLSLFDVTGRLIEHVVNENQPSGTYRKSFSNINLSQGVYFVRLESDDQALVKKVILLR